MFGVIETKLTAREVKLLPGIKRLNEHTKVFRADKYWGEFTRSVGWLLGVHPTLTHTETLTKELEGKIREIKVREEWAEEYQKRLPMNDHRKKIPLTEVKAPPFHLSTEERNMDQRDKKKYVRVLAIHTLISAASLITRLFSKIGEGREIEMIPSDAKQSI